VTESTPLRLDVYCVRAGLCSSRSQAARMIRMGLIKVPGRRTEPALMVRSGDILEIYPDQSSGGFPGRSDYSHLDILYDDGEIVVVNKPAGLVVHPAPGHIGDTLVDLLLEYGGSWSKIGGEYRPGIVHRLDAGTSGLMLVARNDRVHLELSRMLSTRKIKRTYIAIADGTPAYKSATIEGYIGRNIHDRKKMAVVSQDRGKFSSTFYEVIASNERISLLRLQLKTGRTHQIRVHLASIGCPVHGDKMYGQSSILIDRPALHSYKLEFVHPKTGEHLSFFAPPPDDIKRLVDEFGLEVRDWENL